MAKHYADAIESRANEGRPTREIVNILYLKGNSMTQPSLTWKSESVLDFLRKNSATDPVALIRKISRDLVAKAYDAGWSGPPFDPFELAEILEIGVLPNDALTDARIISKHDEFMIEYNPRQRASRINFSIAHELGHVLFPDCAKRVRNREAIRASDAWEIEFLCNVAASEILLPYKFFADELNDSEPSIDTILELAERYSASLEAVMLRSIEVVDKQCAMMIASFHNDQTELFIDYFKSTRNFNVRLEKAFLIPKSSSAYECVNSGWTSKSKETWDVFGEREYHIHCIGLPPLRNSVNQRVGIFIIPPDALQIQDFAIKYELGDATKPRGGGNKIIAQVVNTMAGLGMGFGRAMSAAWPKSATALKTWRKDSASFTLGEARLTKLGDDIYVFQMLAQKGLKPSREGIPLRYESLRKCLIELAHVANDHFASVHMPRIGAGQAGGKWAIIEWMLYDELIGRGVGVTVYDIPGTRANFGQALNLKQSIRCG